MWAWVWIRLDLDPDTSGPGPGSCWARLGSDWACSWIYVDSVLAQAGLAQAGPVAPAEELRVGSMAYGVGKLGRPCLVKMEALPDVGL